MKFIVKIALCCIFIAQVKTWSGFETGTWSALVAGVAFGLIFFRAADYAFGGATYLTLDEKHKAELNELVKKKLEELEKKE